MFRSKILWLLFKTLQHKLFLFATEHFVEKTPVKRICPVSVLLEKNKPANVFITYTIAFKCLENKSHPFFSLFIATTIQLNVK